MAETEDKCLLQKLKSTDSADVYSALLKISKTFKKDCVKRKKLFQGSVIKTILSFVEHPKFSNISLSIIADACLEKSILFEVIKNDGIKSLIRIMKSLVNDDIQNRACRALGNIAKSDEGFKAIHLMKPISNIVNFLMGTQNVNCQQTAVRTLRILGKNSKSRDVIVRENGIISIAKLLHSSHKDILLCSTKALAELTINCNICCARQLLEMHSLKMLVKLNNHEEKDIRTHALISLKNISSQDETRSDLIKEGALNLFTEIAGKYELVGMRRLAALALCNCLNYIHMWNNYGVSRSAGLKSLLEVLRNKELEGIHVHVVSSLLPLCYEQGVAEILLDLEVLQILIQNLKNFITQNKVDHCEHLLHPGSMPLLSDLSPKNLKPIDLNSNSVESPSYEDCLSPVINCYETNTYANEQSFFNFNNLSSVKTNTLSIHVKYTPKFDTSSCLNFHSSGASSYCSPSSSGSNTAMSPNVFSDYNPGSPLGDPWSPNSNVECPPLCWSPVLSCSDSSDLENDAQDKKIKYENVPCPDISDTPHVDISDIHSVNKYAISIPPVSKFNSPFLSKKSFTHIFSTCDTDQDVMLNPDFENSSVSEHHPPKIQNSDEKEITSNLVNKETTLLKKHKLEPTTETILNLQLPVEDSGNKRIKISTQCSNIEQIDLQPSEICNYKYEKYGIDHHVLALLAQLSYVEKKTNFEFASFNFFSVLLDYISLVQNPNPKAETFLLNLVKNRYTFEKLIKNGFVAEIETRLAVKHDPDRCVRCLELNTFHHNLLSAVRLEAESYYGVGTLCHILSTADKSSQMHALHVITKLIIPKLALFRLIIQAKGLSLLLEHLKDTSETSSRAVISLCQLYQNLKKSTNSEATEKCCFSGTCSSMSSSRCSFKDALPDVTFCVDGIKISASRETICSNSDYFNALLKGHFSESHKNVITMSDISAETLTTIFHFLHGCNTGNSCPYIKRIPFSILLELLYQCEKFLLLVVKTFVEDKLCHNLFHNTVSKIYQVAKQCNSCALFKKALSFALCIDVSQKDILLRCFYELMSLEEHFNVLTDIQLLIESTFSECILKNLDD